MKKTTRYASTSAVPAIAAVLALISTPGLAQEVPAQPVPTTSTPAPVTVDAPPVTDTTAAPTVETTDIPAPVSTAPETPTPKAKPRPVAKAAPKPAPEGTVTHVAHASAPANPTAPAAPAPATRTSSVVPIVNTQAPSAAPTPAANATEPTNGPEDRTAMELGGGALVLLALGAGAFALARRRRQDEEVDEGYYESEPVAEAEPEAFEPAPRHDPVHEEQPAIVAPAASAFAWGNAPSAASPREDDGSDRRPGESWVERAYRGPSPANPSVSLKNRLRRAAFFDKRERDVAAGTAEPVDTDAGLPDALAEEQERELA